MKIRLTLTMYSCNNAENIKTAKTPSTGLKFADLIGTNMHSCENRTNSLFHRFDQKSLGDRDNIGKSANESTLGGESMRHHIACTLMS